jgi:hypothetical protein
MLGEAEQKSRAQKVTEARPRSGRANNFEIRF